MRCSKRAMIVRFSQSGPEKLSPDAKPLDVGLWSAAWDAVETALAKVAADFTPALEKARRSTRRSPRSKPRSRRRARRRRGASSPSRSTPPRPRTCRCRSPTGSPGSVGRRLRRGADDRRRGRAEPEFDPPRRHRSVDRRGWSDVALTVSTARVARAVDVVDLPGSGSTSGSRRSTNRPFAARRRRRRLSPPRRPAGRRSPRRRRPPPRPTRRQRRRLRRSPAEDAAAQLQASAYTAAFKAAGRVTLASDGSQKSFVLGRVVVQPTLSVKTAPSVDPIAYVEAHFVDRRTRRFCPAGWR